MLVRDRLIGTEFILWFHQAASADGFGNRPKNGSELKPRKFWTHGKKQLTWRRREASPGQDPGNCSGDSRAGNREADRLSNRFGMTGALDPNRARRRGCAHNDAI